MRIVDKANYEQYLADNEVSHAWQKRDFVTEVEKYMDSSLNKVLLISGLRGTGKSVGVLQAMNDRDAVYITMEQGIYTSVNDIMKLNLSKVS